MMYTRYCRTLKPCTSWNQRPGLLQGVRTFSSTRCTYATTDPTPLSQRMARRIALVDKKSSRAQVHHQQKLEKGYTTEYGKIMPLLAKLNINNILSAENLFRVKRNAVWREGHTPVAAARLARSNSWKMDYLEHMSDTEAEALNSDKNIAELFYAGGMTDLSRLNQREYQSRGKHSLQVAFELGYHDAAIDYARIVLNTAAINPMVPALQGQSEGHSDPKRPPVDLPKGMLDQLHKSALSRSNWRAMTVYLDYMLRKPQFPAEYQLLFEIAKDLFTMVKPSHTTLERTPVLEKYELPWFLLQKAADAHFDRDNPNASVLKSWKEAVKAGSDQWSDPRATESLLNLSHAVSPGSQKWLELVTQMAMQGDASACFSLGDYYIKRDGWHSEYRKSTRPTGRTGVWWIEISAYGALQEPKVLARRYLLLAKLMQENGFAEEAIPCLMRGQNALGDEPVTREARREMEWLQGCINKWNDVDWNMTSTKVLNQEGIYMRGIAPTLTDKKTSLVERDERTAAV